MKSSHTLASKYADLSSIFRRFVLGHRRIGDMRDAAHPDWGQYTTIPFESSLLPGQRIQSLASCELEVRVLHPTSATKYLYRDGPTIESDPQKTVSSVDDLRS
jgi:hypothetical protein